MAARVLIAGLGNIFLGDDGFGVAVAQALQGRPLPAGVRAVDFGIRAFDLAGALAACDAAILVDATARGGAPGTLYVLEPQPAPETAALDAHTLTPERVLAGLPREALPRVLRLVGCEPLSCEPDEEPADADLCALSPPVRAQVAAAVALVEKLAYELSAEAAHA